jgi:hypothetical protein
VVTAALCLFTDRGIAADPSTLLNLCVKKNRIVAGAWRMVFTDPKCSKAILLGTKETPDEKHKKRTQWMLQMLGKMVTKFFDFPESEARRRSRSSGRDDSASNGRIPYPVGPDTSSDYEIGRTSTRRVPRIFPSVCQGGD